MKPRDIFLSALKGEAADRPAVGSATSVATIDLMERVGAYFPQAHLDAEQMAALAAAGHTELGYDNVMPLFSVCHEAAALGCDIDWGAPDRMPDRLNHLCDDINEKPVISGEFLEHPACRVPLDALNLLKERLGNDVAVVGKVFGPWTLGYHLYGLENFLIATITEPDAVKRAMETLIDVTIRFGRAQLEAGADALTLADHCTRDLCSPDTYRDFLIEVHQELKTSLNCPLILHICGDTADRIQYIRKTGIDCFHFDSKVPAARARELAGKELALMGGDGQYRDRLARNPGNDRGGCPG
ncbi:uroporphyrinogen decarboxylase family protein [candidate division KSB1 bacterium]